MLTGLQALSAGMVLELLYNVISKEGVIGRESFEWCFDTIAEKIDAPLATKDESGRIQILDVLFDLFVDNGDGVVDPMGLAAGLSVLCNGCDEKAVAVSALYD